MHLKKSICVLLIFCCLFSSPIFAAAESARIASLSLEELMNTEVTSVTRSSKPLSQSAAAVTVITQEDIRRSGATMIPEILRLVPGMQVARMTANQWAISTRGFNGALVTKLLVLIDGRTVYSPLHSGVYWDVQDTMIEDIERIEVIRGPGASVWGSNAVNGVINIITKNSKDTHGGVVTGLGGSEEQGGALRYGGKIGEKGNYRAYAKYTNRDSSHLGNDAWYLSQYGMRSDWDLDEEDKITFDGAYYNGEEDLRTTLSTLTPPFRQILNADGVISGGHFLTRWEHAYSDTSDSTLQVYYDQTYRDSIILDETRYTGDIDWKHRFAVGDRNEVVWGLGYRLNADETEGSFSAYFDPGGRVDNLYQAFLQDTLTIVHDRLWFTAGSKFEINDYSGFEVQPTARLLWQPHEKHSFWGAVSRAVRIPSRLDHDLQLNGWFVPGAALGRLEGDKSRRSEALIAYELGYRVQAHRRVTLDIATFINDYSRLTTTRLLGTGVENGFPITRYGVDDDMDGKAVGAEIAAKTQILDNLLINSGYTFLELYLDAGQNALGSAEAPEGQSPQHQIFVNPRLDLPGNLELDANMRYVDSLKRSRVPAYWEMDLRLAWRPVRSWELSVVGQNLFHNHHQEFPASGNPEIQRAVYGKTVIEF